ncbi:unnamed protein product [Oppiella nova]|uniref:SAM domain-containing protein n=1 Tax=Oppiella nova TaxID=334625 RepID=A0A7R9MM80_9ACAR|nr:unnamed protein product [Oppiella nova]CAG2178796.1 unnamed protein product [Oppiella nova]
MVVSARFDGKNNARKMPHLNRESTFWSYIQTLLEDLKCCPFLLSDVKLGSTCDKCGAKGCPPTPPATTTAAAKGSVVKKSEPSVLSTDCKPKPNAVTKSVATETVSVHMAAQTLVSTSSTPIKRKISDIEFKSTPDSSTRNPVRAPKSPKLMNNTPAIVASTADISTPPTHRISIVTHRTAPPMTPTSVSVLLSPPTPVPVAAVPIPPNPAEWTIDDVIRHLISVDASLESHADTFRKHEIDGKAFLLLNSDMMMKYMGLKLGPALKICNITDRLKSNKRVSSYLH